MATYLALLQPEQLLPSLTVHTQQFRSSGPPGRVASRIAPPAASVAKRVFRSLLISQISRRNWRLVEWVLRRNRLYCVLQKCIIILDTPRYTPSIEK